MSSFHTDALLSPIGDSGARGLTSHNFATVGKQVSQSSAALSGVVQDRIKTGTRESIGGKLAGAEISRHDDVRNLYLLFR